MKTKIMIVALIAMFISATGFDLHNSEKRTLNPIVPDYFYLNVTANNLPNWVEIVNIKIYLDGTQWGETLQIDPAGSSSIYYQTTHTNFHSDMSAGTISVWVEYFNQYGCRYHAYQQQTAFFYILHPANFTFNAYSYDCD